MAQTHLLLSLTLGVRGSHLGSDSSADANVKEVDEECNLIKSSSELKLAGNDGTN